MSTTICAIGWLGYQLDLEMLTWKSADHVPKHPPTPVSCHQIALPLNRH